MGRLFLNRSLASQYFNKLKIEKLVENDTLEKMKISLEKKAVFPSDILLTDAELVVLKGDIASSINQEPFHLKKQNFVNMPKKGPQWIKAKENFQFLIIR